MKRRFFKILFVALSFSLLISTIILAASGSNAVITDATFSSVIMNITSGGKMAFSASGFTLRIYS